MALFYLSKNATVLGNFVDRRVKNIFFAKRQQRIIDRELRKREKDEADLKKYERFLGDHSSGQ